ncbi:MAG: HD domain-containing protein [Acidisphaera sp.]|nr:HD domain-containing protein [Acidisphaera sp.]
MFALVLSERVEEVDQAAVVQMLLIHDIVEIDAGDAPIHVIGTDASALQRTERKAQSVSLACFLPSKAKSCWRYGWNLKQRKHHPPASRRPLIACNPCF